MIKWKLINKKVAKEIGLRYIEEFSILIIDLAIIPPNISLYEFIENIQQQGIALKYEAD